MVVQVRVGEVVLDPVCGGGSLLLQAAERQLGGGEWACGGGYAVGAELEPGPARLARQNLQGGSAGWGRGAAAGPAGSVGCWDVLNCDSRLCHFRTGCIDCVLADLPFGKRCGSPAELAALYGKILGQLARILRPDGRCRAVRPLTRPKRALRQL